MILMLIAFATLIVYAELIAFEFVHYAYLWQKMG